VSLKLEIVPDPLGGWWVAFPDGAAPRSHYESRAEAEREALAYLTTHPAPGRVVVLDEDGDTADVLRPPRVTSRAFSVEEHDRDGTLVLVVAGELDVVTAPKLNKRVNVAVSGDGANVVIDLCDVAFIDSTGLQVLLLALRHLTRRERRLALVCPPGAVQRAMGQAGMLEMFTIFQTREDALPTGRRRRGVGRRRPATDQEGT
jgi:anti-sigma B factor antagonist